MSGGQKDRRKIWTGPARPAWVQRINEQGPVLDLKSVVPLDENSLLAQAKANTGLSDFGTDEWYEPFVRLTKAFDEESQLTLMGRLMTRSDMLIFLEARLRIEETYKQHPEIEYEQIIAPLFITGQGRTGTSELHNVVAADPDNAVTLNWEVMFPVPPPEKESYRTDPRIEKANRLFKQYFDVMPELYGVFDYAGDIPCENVHTACLSFRGSAYLNANQGQVPSFLDYMQTQDPTLPYRYEKRLCKLLQWKNPRKRWVFKSPYAMVELPTVLEVYPDVKFVMTVRDPIKSMSSAVDLIGSLSWVRSDVSFIGGSIDQFLDPRGTAGMLNQVVDWLESGAVPTSQMLAIQFHDFIRDQMGAVEKIYGHYGIELSAESRAAMEAHIASNRHARKPKHHYEVGDSEMIAEERKLFKRYQDYFSIADEV